MAGVRKRKGYWQIWWRVKGVRYYDPLPFDKYTQAAARKEATRREVEGTQPPRKDLKFSDFAAMFIEKRYKTPSTKIRCEFTALSFSRFLASCGDISLKDITENLIRDYIHAQETTKPKPRSAAGINCDLRNLRIIFCQAVKDKIFDQSPIQNIRYLKEVKKVVQIPTDVEVKNILLWFQKNDIITFPWVYLMATWGWRRDELRHLRVSDVDLEANKIYIRETKTGVERAHDLQEQDVMILAEHFHQLRKRKLYHPKGLVFPSRRGNLQGRNKIYERVKWAAKRCGITKPISPHIFRHRVVTNLLDQTGNTEVIKSITGHKDTRTILEHYAHSSKEAVKQGLKVTTIDLGFVPKRVPEKGSK